MDILAAKCVIFFPSSDWDGTPRYWKLEYWASKHSKKHQNTPLLNHHDTRQPRNHQRKIENVHLKKSTYCLDKFLQDKIGFLKKKLYNKQKIIDNLINLLNDVTTKRDEAKFSCKSFQIKTTSQKANNVNETISSNRFSIAQNKNQVNVAKEQVPAAPSNTSTKQNIENYQNSNTITQCRSEAWSRGGGWDVNPLVYRQWLLCHVTFFKWVNITSSIRTTYSPSFNKM